MGTEKQKKKTRKREITSRGSLKENISGIKTYHLDHGNCQIAKNYHVLHISMTNHVTEHCSSLSSLRTFSGLLHSQTSQHRQHEKLRHYEHTSVSTLSHCLVCTPFRPLFAVLTTISLSLTKIVLSQRPESLRALWLQL